MNTKKQKIQELTELINRYPSPHNGQPMVIKEDKERYEIYFDTSRGLSATPISYLFSFVTIGVFVRYIELCAKALGHHVKVDVSLPSADEMASEGELHCASFVLDIDVAKPEDELRRAILFRQTSRQKYQSGLTDLEKRSVSTVASDHGITADFLNDDDSVQAIWLNQRAVFDDMFNVPVREELRHWIRFDQFEKNSKKDGLAYDCMELSGAALKFVFKYYKILHWPIVAPILRRYYLRTMQDSSSVGYVTSPFETEQQAYTIGRCVIDLWIEISKSGKYLHPFGTVVSNDQAHHDFARLIGLDSESRNTDYVVFIFRAGSSNVPVESERMAISEHLLRRED